MPESKLIHISKRDPRFQGNCNGNSHEIECFTCHSGNSIDINSHWQVVQWPLSGTYVMGFDGHWDRLELASRWRCEQFTGFMMTSSNGSISALLAICAGISPVPVNFPHKCQWRGALMFSLICAWINCWVNNREAGNQRRYSAHYDVTVLFIPGSMVKVDYYLFTMTVLYGCPRNT